MADRLAEMGKNGAGARPEVRIGGQLYRLQFDLYALEEIEKKFGGVRQAFEQLRGGGMGSAVRELFAILANSARDADGLPADVSGDVIGKHTSLRAISEISAAIQAAVEAGMKSETNGGEADDNVRDAYAEEYNEKNG
jgi:hypothetical protein